MIKPQRLLQLHMLSENMYNVFPIPLLSQHVMPVVSTRNLGVIADDNFKFR